MTVHIYCASIVEGFSFSLHWREPYSWSHVQLGFLWFTTASSALSRHPCEFLKCVFISSFGAVSIVSSPSLAHMEAMSTPSSPRKVVHFHLSLLIWFFFLKVSVKVFKFYLLGKSQLLIFAMFCIL